MRIFTRQHLRDIIQSAATMTGQKLDEPRCIECDHFDSGFCKKWQDTIPVEAWKDGCDHWELFVPF